MKLGRSLYKLYIVIQAGLFRCRFLPSGFNIYTGMPASRYAKTYFFRLKQGDEHA